jgi:hypothetical protein
MQSPETESFAIMLTDICTTIAIASVVFAQQLTRPRIASRRSIRRPTEICTLGGVITGTNECCPIMKA